MRPCAKTVTISSNDGKPKAYGTWKIEDDGNFRAEFYTETPYIWYPAGKEMELFFIH